MVKYLLLAISLLITSPVFAGTPASLGYPWAPYSQSGGLQFSPQGKKFIGTKNDGSPGNTVGFVNDWFGNASESLLWNSDGSFTFLTPINANPVIFPFTFATLPASDPVNPGRIVRLTDNIGGLWFDTGTTWRPLFGGEIDVSMPPFNAKCDVLSFSDGIATALSNTFTSASASWTAADIGKFIQIVGAGAAGVNFSTTIASINTPNSIQLTAQPSTSVNPATYVYGTDSSASLQSAINAISSVVGGSVLIPYNCNIGANNVKIKAGIRLHGLNVPGNGGLGSGTITNNSTPISCAGSPCPTLYNDVVGGMQSIEIDHLRFIGLGATTNNLIDLTNTNSLRMHDNQFQAWSDGAAEVAITGAANNGLGLIRITTGAPHGLFTNEWVLIGGIVGTTEANEAWKVTVIDPTTVDLQGSAFIHAWVSGGSIQGISAAIHLDGSVLTLGESNKFTGTPSQVGSAAYFLTNRTRFGNSAGTYRNNTTTSLTYHYLESTSSGTNRYYDNNLDDSAPGTTLRSFYFSSCTNTKVYHNHIELTNLVGTANTAAVVWANGCNDMVLTGNDYGGGRNGIVINNDNRVSFNNRIERGLFNNNNRPIIVQSTATDTFIWDIDTRGSVAEVLDNGTRTMRFRRDTGVGGTFAGDGVFHFQIGGVAVANAGAINLESMGGAYQGIVRATHPSNLAQAPKNNSGTFTISDANLSVVVNLTVAEPDTNYRILATVESHSAAPAAGSTTILGISKAVGTFTPTLTSAPGVGQSVTFNWMLVR